MHDEQRRWLADYQHRMVELQSANRVLEDEEASRPLLDPHAQAALARRRLAVQRGFADLAAEFSRESERFRSRGAALAERSAVRWRVRWRWNGLIAIATWVAATTAVLLGAWSHPQAASPDFYSAIATTIPGLVIAGFVELSANRGVIVHAGFGWRTISFILPAAASETTCLAALVHHDSTQGRYAVAVVGLIATAVTLVTLVLTHERQPAPADPGAS